MAIQFDRKISIDGVAVIIAAAASIFWFARLESKVEVNTKDIAVQDTRMDKLTDNAVLMQQNIAVLNALQTTRDDRSAARSPKMLDNKP
jgi:hypothetical protein